MEGKTEEVTQSPTKRTPRSILRNEKSNCFAVGYEQVLAMIICIIIIVSQGLFMDYTPEKCPNNRLMRHGCLCDLKIVKLGQKQACTDDMAKFCHSGRLILENDECIAGDNDLCQANSVYDEEERKCKCIEEFIESMDGVCTSCREDLFRVYSKILGKCGGCLKDYSENEFGECVKVQINSENDGGTNKTKTNSTTIIILVVVCFFILVGLIAAIVFAVKKSSNKSSNPWMTHILTQDHENIQNCYIDPAEAMTKQV
ncbi:MAG: hypothetical protein MHMPM18_002743 [Marteilia pararefringens]